MYLYSSAQRSWLSGKLSAQRIISEQRGLQVLGNVMNELQQHRLITCCIVGLVLMSSISLNICIKASNNWVVGFLGLSVLLTTGMLIIVCLGEISQVYVQSEENLQVVKQYLAQRSSNEFKWQRKFLQSCSHIKVMFGSYNFVDQLTPLNVFLFGVNLTVNIILLSK